MEDYDLKLLKLDIICKKIVNIKELLRMGSDCLNTYIDSALIFGVSSKVTKDIVNIWWEFFYIVREEKKLFNFLLENYDKMDICEIDEFMADMYALSGDTIQYYYDVLDDIEVACDMQLEWKAKRPMKSFKTLIESDKYRERVCGLALNESDIEEFFLYPKEFWDYIDVRTIILDSHLEEEKDFWGINLKMDGEKLVDLKVFVPDVVNLETALVNVHEFKNAYELYRRLGQTINESDTYYEIMGRDSEKKFKGEYMVKKRQQMFYK